MLLTKMHDYLFKISMFAFNLKSKSLPIRIDLNEITILKNVLTISNRYDVVMKILQNKVFLTFLRFLYLLVINKYLILSVNSVNIKLATQRCVAA